MFIWHRLNIFDELLIPFHHYCILSHSFLLSLSTRTTLYHQSFCPLDSELCLCHSEVNHSQCWSAGEDSPEGRLYQPPISSITPPRCQLLKKTCFCMLSLPARVRLWPQRWTEERVHLINPLLPPLLAQVWTWNLSLLNTFNTFACYICPIN